MVEFLDEDGVPLAISPSTSSIFSMGDESCAVDVGVPLAGGQTYRFRSVRDWLTVPASYDNDIDTTLVEFEIRGGVSSNSIVADPGQGVRLVDATPADNSARIASLRKAIGKLQRDPRRAKKAGDRKKIRKLKKKLRAAKKRLRALL